MILCKGLIVSIAIFIVSQDLGPGMITVAKNKGNCPDIEGFPGKVRYKRRGTKAQFRCPKGSIRHGEKFVICQADNTWSGEPPACIRRGCVPIDISTQENLDMTEKNSGALLEFSCENGYQLIGATETFCDGVRWSAPVPTCTATSELTECDFETDLCGWSQEQQNDQKDWRRNIGTTLTGDTGPKHDHTKGEESGNGHYLYFESSSPTITDDEAWLVSPKYTPDLSPACFDFWYHMYGPEDQDMVGSLSVYVVGESQFIDDMAPDFHKAGNQGHMWKRGNIKIAERDEDFTIIIVGVRRLSYFSDIAIDDVRLYNCSEETNDSTTEPPAQSSTTKTTITTTQKLTTKATPPPTQEETSASSKQQETTELTTTPTQTTTPAQTKPPKTSPTTQPTTKASTTPKVITTPTTETTTTTTPTTTPTTTTTTKITTTTTTPTTTTKPTTKSTTVAMQPTKAPLTKAQTTKQTTMKPTPKQTTVAVKTTETTTTEATMQTSPAKTSKTTLIKKSPTTIQTTLPASTTAHSTSSRKSSPTYRISTTVRPTSKITVASSSSTQKFITTKNTGSKKVSTSASPTAKISSKTPFAVTASSSTGSGGKTKSSKNTTETPIGASDERVAHPEDETLKPLMIGLGVGIIVGLLIIGVVAWVCVRRRKFYTRSTEDELKPITNSGSVHSLNNIEFYNDEEYESES